MLRFRREREVGNLDLDLDLFCAPQYTEQASHGMLQNPFPGFHSPIRESISPLFRSPSTQEKQQQQYSQVIIFYGGTVNVFEVSPDLAETIMVMASRGSSSTSSFAYQIPTPKLPTKMSSVDHTDRSQPSITPKPGNFPLARQRSLQRFLEKKNAKAAVHTHLHHN